MDKIFGGQHHEDTSSHNSDTQHNDVEKRDDTINRVRTAPRDNDAVTMKTWAVVVVSLSLLNIYSGHF